MREQMFALTALRGSAWRGCGGSRALPTSTRCWRISAEAPAGSAWSTPSPD